MDVLTLPGSPRIKLEVKNLRKCYGSKVVLDHIHFSVRDGEFLSILGPSGCGKTTLLRILVGLLEPTGGAVVKDGVDITALRPAERKMGIVFQNYALFENMSVLRNVEYALKRNRATKDTAREVALRALEQVRLTDSRHKKPLQLSGGQQQRVAIARTLALNPDIILFDEPMSALDVATRLSLRQEIKRIQKESGSTMVYITHDQEEAFALSDRIMVMSDGEIHQIGEPLELIRHPADDYVRDFVVKNMQIKIESLTRFMGDPVGRERHGQA